MMLQLPLTLTLQGVEWAVLDCSAPSLLAVTSRGIHALPKL